MQPRSSAAGGTPRGVDPVSAPHTVEFSLDGFAWSALSNEAQREGATIDELVTFAVLYYLADIDSGRISRSISLSPPTDSAESAQKPPDSPPPDGSVL